MLLCGMETNDIPHISACIVTYRNPIEQVAAAVASFQRVAMPSAMMIVDNDSGADYLAALTAAVDCPIISSGANKGFGFGHNKGWRAMPHAEFHLVLNPDVVIHGGTLERMMSRMDGDPKIGLLVPKVLFPDGRLQPLNKRLPSVFDLYVRRFMPSFVQNVPEIKRRMDEYTMVDVGYDKEVDVPFASGCCMLFRREVLERIGGFDEKFFMYLEDADISIRVRKAGFRVVYTPDAVITHHWARGSHKSARLLWVMIRSMGYYYHKWGWKWR